MNLTAKEEAIPLTPQALYILTALAERPMYGYGVIQQCEQDAGPTITFDPGSIYRRLRRLQTSGFVRISQEFYGTGSPYSRKYFELTSTGKIVLGLESKRLEQALALINGRLKSDAS